MTTEMRYRLSDAIQALLTIAALGMIGFLIWDLAQTGSMRSLLEAGLIGLLVAWPFLRTRLKHRCWFPDWLDPQPFFDAKRRREAP